MAKKNKVKPLDEEVVETPVEETPVEETPVEETPAEETPAEETGIVAVGEKKYATFTDAIADYPVGTKIEMTLLEDALDMSGTIVPEGSDVVFDFGGHKVVVTHDMAGSATSKNQAFQLLKNSTVVMKNGEIEILCNEPFGTKGGYGSRMLIQNYSNLTLENMVLNKDKTIGPTDGTTVTGLYTLSNNFGDTVIKGTTEIYANDGEFAFDVYYWPKQGYGDGVSVTIDKDFTGKVEGRVEYDPDGTQEEGWEEKAKVEIDGGNFDIKLEVSGTDKANITINGGTFTGPDAESVKQYVSPDAPVVIGGVDTFDELKNIVVGIIGDETAAPEPLSDAEIDKIADSADAYGKSDPAKEEE